MGKKTYLELSLPELKKATRFFKPLLGLDSWDIKVEWITPDDPQDTYKSGCHGYCHSDYEQLQAVIRIQRPECYVMGGAGSTYNALATLLHEMLHLTFSEAWAETAKKPLSRAILHQKIDLMSWALHDSFVS